MGRRPTITMYALSAVLVLATNAYAQLRIVDYNTTGGPRTGMNTLLQAIGDESRNGIARPIDVLCVQEQVSVSTTTESIKTLLNSLYGSGTYARSTVNGATTGAGTMGLVYRVASVQLLQEVTVGTTSSDGMARQGLRYKLQLVGYGTQAQFYVYVNHYKSSDTAADRARRNVEAQIVRANSDALGEGTHILYTGDHNMYNSSEAGFQTLISAGAGQAFDPVNMIGSWHDNASYKIVHTQAPAVSPPGGLVGGGVDDRFDWQLCTGEFLDNEGLSIVPNSYHTFGNNGTHTLNGDITSGTGASPAILTLLTTVSDHLPVVADYQVPAVMSVSVGSVASPVIVGASLNVPVTVTNSANVAVAIGADELDYSVSGSGSVSGTASGTANPLAAGNTHNLSFNTSSSGAKTGQVSVTSSSQQVQNGSFSQAVNVTVLDHANASFAGGTDQNTLTIDLGSVKAFTAAPTVNFTMYNLKPSANTAALDLDQVIGSGDTARLTTNLAPFANLAANGSMTFAATLNTSEIGTFQATYTLKVSDQNLPGAVNGTDLTLVLTGAVTTVQADFNIDGHVDSTDFDAFSACYNGPVNPVPPECWNVDLNGDQHVDSIDFDGFSACYNGPVNPSGC